MDAQLRFLITNQTIERVDDFDVVGDSKNYLYAQFDFATEEWDGLVKTALFRRGTNGTVYEVLLENDKCLVPHEVLSGEDRFVYVSVFAGDLITVNKERFYVESSGYWDDAESSVDPTPSVYQQIMDRLADVEDTVIESAESASQSATSASESAVIAQESAESIHEYAETASTKAAEAMQSATSASDSANSASTSAETSSASASRAQTSETNAENYAKQAKSWAVGGTNTRTGEDVDNAKYYAEQAQRYIEDIDWDSIKDKPTTLPGYGIDEIPVSMLEGVINIENLPKSVIERMKVVQNDAARFALTINDVQNGDVVKVESTNLMYYVKDDTKLNSEDGYESFKAGSASSVPWSGVTGKPTTISGYGITNAYSKTEVDNKLANKADSSDVYTKNQTDTLLSGKVNTESGKGLSTNDYTNADKEIVEGISDELDGKVDKVNGKGLSTNDFTTELKNKLDGIESGAEVNVNPDWNASSGKAQIYNKPTTLQGYGVQSVPASMIDGVIGIEHIPPAALERGISVPSEAAKYLLTTSQVQNGDTVKVLANSKIYLVIDDTNLDNDNGYMEYAFGNASSVPWSGVTGKPTTISGYGITNAYNKTEVDNLLLDKVDKVYGKGLSTEDYTTQEKNKLSGIANGADVANPNIAQIETSPTTHAYETGEYLVYNGILYKAKVDIAIGDALTVGTNIEATTVSEAMSSIQPELEFDDTPTEGSTNPVTSDGIYEALQGVGHSEEMTFAQYNALTDAQKNDGTERYITDINTIPRAEGVGF